MSASAEPGILFDTISTASGHRFGRATLNNPAVLNALTLPMIDLLDPRLVAWAEDPDIAGVVLDAVGDRAFCAGGDVVALSHAIRAGAPGVVPPICLDFFEREYRLDYRIHTFPKPLLCWGNGFVMGGGIGLLAGASHRVVTPTTRLAMPEIGIGLFPDVAGTWFLSRMPGRIGLFLALTGAPLNAPDARFAGLADFVLPHERLSSVLDALGGERWAGQPDADGARLSGLLACFATQDVPASTLLAHLDRIDTVIGHDRLQDLAPRLAALADDADPWLSRASQAFMKGSPTSAALAFELQRWARHRSLAEVFRLEYQAAVGCSAHHDFAEGVRALLIDKDRQPRWQPATLDEVTLAWIADHLAPRFAGPHPLVDLL
ncbi:MAG: enoyl-CoA hydratase/isomerase family protein [Chloroflexi bacterium]|nr:enoyl-CoA hydratase/isomerase family protein [Chloroflexota bacterium]